MAPSTLTSPILTHPPINTIPPSLAPHFEPTYLEYHTKYSAGRLATHQIPIEDFRANPSKYIISYGRQIIDQGDLVVTDLKCPVEGGEITVRFIEAAKEEGKEGKRPVYVNFHGGGWVFGGLETDFELCKRVVHDTGCVTIDVDYRLAPEYRFPIPLEDCWTALNWIITTQSQPFNLDLTRLAIGGTSAGGHLAAVIAHMCRDASIPLLLQILLVPVCDLSIFTPTGTLHPHQPYDSYRLLEHTQPLPLERMTYFFQHFLGSPCPEGLVEDWKVSVIKAPSCKGLPKALVVTAEMDVLRDEGEAYAKRMKDEGVDVSQVRIKGAPHIMMQMDAILEGGRECNRLVVEALKGVFGKVD